ncbi:MAG: S-layer homology domain-containing protein, partial [Synergistaceae bacterium]|nr:S-layer homology domain-containing protein [Synergistaceae bacterium]
MRKIALLLAIVSVAVLAAPALSATNPFMDVPMNHWAYDAIGQLAAHGILSGYPDGTYKGKQATTRYEMASALARALAVVDMTKASKQDVEMLKRLVVEFKDELEALGVKVAELDERVAILEDRLGGWKISGTLALQATYRNNRDIRDITYSDGTTEPINEGQKTTFDYDEAKLIFDRWFGEDEEYHFQARFRGDDTAQTNNATLDRFFVEMPFFYDMKLTIGRFSWAWEGAYKVALPETGGFTGDQPMTDWRWDGFGLTKNFGIGSVNALIAHPDHFSGRQPWAKYITYR